MTYLAQPKYLGFLMLSYTMVMVLSNWFDVRLIQIFSFNTDAGTLIFPLTFILSNLITEVYGYQQARRAIWCGFLFNLIFILYSQWVISLPSPDYALINNRKFDEILTFNFRIIVASLCAYLCSEPLNSLVMAKLKIKCEGRMLPLRYVSSTILAAGLDSFVFGGIAFAGLMNSNQLLAFIVTMWFFKVFIECCGLPVSVFITKKLKTLESLDIYDKKTNFSLFCLRVNYTEQDNHYRDPILLQRR